MAAFLKQILSRGSALLGLSKTNTIDKLVSSENKIEKHFIDMFLGHGTTLSNSCPDCGCDCCRVLTGEDSIYEGHCDEWRESREWMEDMCADLDAA